MTKIFIKTTCMLVLIVLGTACSKENDATPAQDAPIVKKSQLELLCQDWILYETYEDNVQKSSNGIGEYQFTRQGAFKFKSNGSWMQIGTFDFTSKDSSGIAVLFSGSTSSIPMNITKLDESKFNTNFTVNGKQLEYKYKR
jgi:hypothetical protein